MLQLDLVATGAGAVHNRVPRALLLALLLALIRREELVARRAHRGCSTAHLGERHVIESPAQVQIDKFLERLAGPIRAAQDVEELLLVSRDERPAACRIEIVAVRVTVNRPEIRLDARNRR
jgi:hypothetical protein